MVNTPIISICIPTFKRPEFLKRAINSILSNGFNDFEIVISDDDPQESAKSVVENFDDKRIIYTVNNTPGVINLNWTNSMKHAKGKYLFKLDDDDYILPGFLSKTVEILEKHSNVNQVFTAYTIHDLSTDTFEDIIDKDFFLNRTIVSGKEYAFAILLNKSRPRNQKTAGVFRKDHAEAINFYKDITVDLMFTIALASMGDIAYIPEPLYVYTRHRKKVREGPSRRHYLGAIESLENLYKLPSITSNQEWVNIKTTVMNKFPLLYTIFFILAITGSTKKGVIDIVKAAIEHTPSLKKSVLFWGTTLLFLCLPCSINYRLMEKYTNSKLLKRIINKMVR